MFGEKLKKLRKEKKIKQEELAELCNVAPTTISNWENNVAQPNFDTLKKLAEHFNVSIDYLLGYDQVTQNKIYKLKTVLMENNMYDPILDEMTEEDLKKAIHIVKIIKDKDNTE